MEKFSIIIGLIASLITIIAAIHSTHGHLNKTNSKNFDDVVVDIIRRKSKNKERSLLWEDPSWAGDFNLMPLRPKSKHLTWAILAAFRRGQSIEYLRQRTGMSHEALDKLKYRVDIEGRLLKEELTPELLLLAKDAGFSFEEIGGLTDRLTAQIIYSWKDWKLPGDVNKIADNSRVPEFSNSASFDPPASYKRLIQYLPEEFRNKYSSELRDFLTDGLAERRASKSSARLFVIFETYNLVLTIGKKRIFKLRQLRQKHLL